MTPSSKLTPLGERVALTSRKVFTTNIFTAPADTEGGAPRGAAPYRITCESKHSRQKC
jgi:hypothetical protein